MTGIEKLKEVLESADFSWTDQDVIVKAADGNYHDIRDINTFVLHFTLLIEIFTELERIKEQLDILSLEIKEN